MVVEEIFQHKFYLREVLGSRLELVIAKLRAASFVINPGEIFRLDGRLEVAGNTKNLCLSGHHG